jgi:NAD(P)-dependent dehydrogenase (short-subunit alcohol dehydrogenase family)
MYNHIAIIGSSGAIGSAFCAELSTLYPQATIHTFSRHDEDYKNHHIIDYTDEKTIENAAKEAAKKDRFDFIIITTGILKIEPDIEPEKSLKDLSAHKFEAIFAANTIFPALIAKHFLSHLNKENRAVFAVLSARVGSISDNRLGGWYAYRSSKTALNMIVKNASIEIGRRSPHAIIVSLHPGTVDSNLSKTFQSQVSKDKLFTSEYSAKKLIDVVNQLTPSDSGKCFAWDGQEIKP